MMILLFLGSCNVIHYHYHMNEQSHKWNYSSPAFKYCHEGCMKDEASSNAGLDSNQTKYYYNAKCYDKCGELNSYKN